MGGDELADDLERFRLEWIEETRKNKGAVPVNAAKQEHKAVTSSSIATAPAITATATAAAAAIPVEPEKDVKKAKSALEVYGDAVQAERQGRMNDALQGYRQAFKMDDNIDKAYHRLTLAQQRASSTQPAPADKHDAEQDGFHFERTVQLAPDYEPNKERRTAETIKQETGSTSRQGDHEDLKHPSSTRFLLGSLAKSFAENPFPFDAAGQAANVTPQEAVDAAHFEPLEEDKPVPIARLPREILLLILKFVLLSPIHAPSTSTSTVATADEDVPATAKRHGRKPRSLREQSRLLELELGLLPDPAREWRTDVEALERFAAVSRYARIVTLDDALWRPLCQRTYSLPPYRVTDDEPLVTVRTAHGGDWRRMYIEQPRIRLDGTFIAVVTYLRRGDSSASGTASSSASSWTAPSHLITFYRYLRFYASGLVLSLLTTDEPSTIVRSFNPSLRTKGLTIGKWHLSSPSTTTASSSPPLVVCESLEDPSVAPDARKYAFRMELRLKSTARGRMNKLDMVALATENRATGELEDVPLRPVKPFFFSKVASYAAEDVD